MKIYFEKSNGSEDWKNNFRFCAVAYNDMKNKWRCHRGFLSVWRAAEPYLRDVILDASVKRVLVVGYSHGAAIATLCHEYIWFNRPDLRESLETFAFGSPRVIWGALGGKLAARWRGLLRIKNREDIVTHLPLAVMGYRHVGKAVRIGCVAKNGFVRAHYPERYLEELQICRDTCPHTVLMVM